jgi:hypothetical protein
MVGVVLEEIHRRLRNARALDRTWLPIASFYSANHRFLDGVGRTADWDPDPTHSMVIVFAPNVTIQTLFVTSIIAIRFAGSQDNALDI